MVAVPRHDTHGDGRGPSRRACWAKIRDGSSCRREPLPGTRYCPSHKQLDDGVAQTAIALAA